MKALLSGFRSVYRNYNQDTDEDEEEEESEDDSEEDEEDEEENDYKAMGHSCGYQQEITFCPRTHNLLFLLVSVEDVVGVALEL